MRVLALDRFILTTFKCDLGNDTGNFNGKLKVCMMVEFCLRITVLCELKDSGWMLEIGREGKTRHLPECNEVSMRL